MTPEEPNWVQNYNGFNNGIDPSDGVGGKKLELSDLKMTPHEQEMKFLIDERNAQITSLESQLAERERNYKQLYEDAYAIILSQQAENASLRMEVIISPFK